MSSVYLLVCLCIFCKSMPGNAGSEDDQDITKKMLEVNSAVRRIYQIRTHYGVIPSLKYDTELSPENSATLIIEPITDKFIPATNNEEFWNSVIRIWNDRIEKFFASQWNSLNNINSSQNHLALLYWLYIFSPRTTQFFIQETRTQDGGLFMRDVYSVTTYFHPILPIDMTASATVFKYADAFNLLNNARQFLDITELVLKPEMMIKADEILKSLKSTIYERYNPELTEKFPGFKPYAQISSEQILQLLEHTGEFSIFAYKIPEDEDLANYLTKFPFALMKQLLFTDYTNSFQQHYEKDKLFYTQIRRDCYQLLNPSITEVGMSSRIIGHLGKRYSLFVIYYRQPTFTVKHDIAKIDKLIQEKFNFEDILAHDGFQFHRLIDYIAILPQLDLKENMLRYREDDMLRLNGTYDPSVLA